MQPHSRMNAFFRSGEPAANGSTGKACEWEPYVCNPVTKGQQPMRALNTFIINSLWILIYDFFNAGYVKRDHARLFS